MLSQEERTIASKAFDRMLMSRLKGLGVHLSATENRIIIGLIMDPVEYEDGSPYDEQEEQE